MTFLEAVLGQSVNVYKGQANFNAGNVATQLVIVGMKDDGDASDGGLKMRIEHPEGGSRLFIQFPQGVSPDVTVTAEQNGYIFEIVDQVEAVPVVPKKERAMRK